MVAIVTSRVAYKALFLHKNEIVDKLKDPLRFAIVAAHKVLKLIVGDIIRETTCSKITHSILDIKEEYLHYEQDSRQRQMFSAALDLLAFEGEHDFPYRFLEGFFLDRVIQKILDGQWESRLDGEPYYKEGLWTEPTPHSDLVGKLLAHRLEIAKIIGYKAKEE